MDKYPKEATERFDNANFHINYCLLFIKKFLKGDVLEVGAGCGSFTRSYYKSEVDNIILTEKDPSNIVNLKNKFKKDTNITVLDSSINELKNKYD